MSKVDAERLVKEVKQNSQLRTAFKQAGPTGFEEVARSAGFNCTKEEYAEEVKRAIVDRELASQLAVTTGIVTSAVSSVI